jgi:branched-chain amino acid aminotransferase
MKIVNGSISLKALHFERLLSSLDLLGFVLPKNLGAAELEAQVISLAKKNGHDAYGRARLNIFRRDGGLYDPVKKDPNFLIETFQLERTIGHLNDNGLTVDIYKDARKAADNFSHIKTNSGLPYVMAAHWAMKNKLNDALLLNPLDRLADSTIANVFVVSGGIIKTPALTEGCIGGVMRKHLIDCCRREAIPLEETGITVAELQNASEVFLTNAIRGIKWVKQVGQAGYHLQVAKLLYEKFVKKLWE